MQGFAFVVAWSALSASVAAAQGRPATLEGVVRDTTGRPLSDVQISLVATDLKTRSDSTGHYRFDSIPAGSVLVRTSLIGYISAQRTVVLSPGGRATLNFSILPSALVGEKPIIAVPVEQADSQ